MKNCKVQGCGKLAMYKKEGVCQMHYFRRMRYGTYDLTRGKPKPRRETPKGYQLVFQPEHALADRRGYVYEHRAVIYQVLNGNCSSCQICGKDESWGTCHVDHIDENVRNNSAENLRVLCRGCNVFRGATPSRYAGRSDVGLLACGGKKDTAHGWSRDPRVSVTSQTILRRKRSGWTDYDAIFTPGRAKPTRELNNKAKAA